MSYFIIIAPRPRVIYQSCSVLSIKNTKPIKSGFANANLYRASWSMHSVFSLKKPSHYRRARVLWGPGGNYHGTKLYSIRCRPLAAPEEIIPAADSASFAIGPLFIFLFAWYIHCSFYNYDYCQENVFSLLERTDFNSILFFHIQTRSFSMNF